MSLLIDLLFGYMPLNSYKLLMAIFVNIIIYHLIIALINKKLNEDIGLNIFHADTSACLIIDGKIVAASEEERFTRVKHYSGFPVNSILMHYSSAI